MATEAPEAEKTTKKKNSSKSQWQSLASGYWSSVVVFGIILLAFFLEAQQWLPKLTKASSKELLFLFDSLFYVITLYMMTLFIYSVFRAEPYREFLRSKSDNAPYQHLHEAKYELKVQALSSVINSIQLAILALFLLVCGVALVVYFWNNLNAVLAPKIHINDISATLALLYFGKISGTVGLLAPSATICFRMARSSLERAQQTNHQRMLLSHYLDILQQETKHLTGTDLPVSALGHTEIAIAARTLWADVSGTEGNTSTLPDPNLKFSEVANALLKKKESD